MGAANPLPYGSGASDVTVNSAGTLDLAGQSASVNGLWGTGTIDNSIGSGTLVVGNNDVSSVFSGVLQNSGGTAAPLGLTKTGSGSFTLSSANANSGLTTVQAGVLYLGTAGALPGPALVTGGTLDASGFAQSIYSVSIGSLGSLNLAVGNLITSAGSDSFAGTLNVLGFSGGTQELMSYNSHMGTFDHVAGLLPNYQLYYGANELDIVHFSTGAPIWQAVGGGSWNSQSNWNSFSVPNGAGKTAVVGADTGSSASITLDTPQTLGTLVFSNTSGNSAAGYSLDSGTAGSLTLDNTGSTAQIVVNAGTHAITAPVYLVGGDLTVSASNHGMLTIGGSITQDTTRNLTLDGDGTGELILSGSNSLGGTSGTATVSAGTLVLNNNEALADGPSLTVGDASAVFGGIQPAGASNASSGAVSIAPVPEPGTLVLLAAVLGGLAIRRGYRRNRRP
jgi:autotransporter-associated beta strand protein